ncbi:MAG TPA: hypothetical protein VKI62_07695 [Bacteroidota bacterium]|nr:hypothetical protein [Bacteroidota bacterium]
MKKTFFRFCWLFVLVPSILVPSYSQEFPPWAMPVKLGDSLSTIFSVLGKPMKKTHWESVLGVEWFPDSGVVVWYDTLSMKIYQIGVNCIDRKPFRSYKKDVFLDLKVTDNIEKWKKILGKTSSVDADLRDKNLTRYKWKTSSFLITVEVWMNEFSDKSGFHSGGSIASVLLQDIINRN